MASRFGSAADYARALSAVDAEGIHPAHRTLLLAHLGSPDHTVSWLELAPKAGYADDDTVKLQYGRFAHRIANELGVPKRRAHGFWLNVLADWADHRDSNGHTRFRLRPEVVEAVGRLGWTRATYLLVWNPSKWQWDDFGRDIERCRIGKLVMHWTCGVRRSIPVGSRMFLMRLGSSVRGIIGSAYSTQPVYEERHSDRERARRGYTQRTVVVRFDVLHERPLVFRHELDRPPFAGALWSPQSGGVRVPEPQATALEHLWLKRSRPVWADDLPSPRFTEGAPMTVTVNGHERNDEAREACIAHHGLACTVCGMTFDSVYGADFAGLIHVHHLDPMAASRGRRRVDPVRDLVPICPNCHVAVHSKRPPYTPAELKRLLASRRRARR